MNQYENQARIFEFRLFEMMENLMEMYELHIWERHLILRPDQYIEQRMTQRIEHCQKGENKIELMQMTEYFAAEEADVAQYKNPRTIKITTTEYRFWFALNLLTIARANFYCQECKKCGACKCLAWCVFVCVCLYLDDFYLSLSCPTYTYTVYPCISQHICKFERTTPWHSIQCTH